MFFVATRYQEIHTTHQEEITGKSVKSQDCNCNYLQLQGHLGWHDSCSAGARREVIPVASPGQEEGTQVSDIYAYEVETGCQALAAVLGRESRQLHQVMASANFRPVADADMVPVRPCLHCRDGGLRTVGYLCGSITARPVLACDTCGDVTLIG
jgi:hypothetical protein